MLVYLLETAQSFHLSVSFMGGANSIRAFKLRSIGPGTYSDSLTLTDPTYFFDQSGDVKLEANIELRWSIHGLNGLFFMI